MIAQDLPRLNRNAEKYPELAYPARPKSGLGINYVVKTMAFYPSFILFILTKYFVLERVRKECSGYRFLGKYSAF